MQTRVEREDYSSQSTEYELTIGDLARTDTPCCSCRATFLASAGPRAETEGDMALTPERAEASPIFIWGHSLTFPSWEGLYHCP